MGTLDLVTEVVCLVVFMAVNLQLLIYEMYLVHPYRKSSSYVCH